MIYMDRTDIQWALKYRPTVEEWREAMNGAECLHYGDYLDCRTRAELPERDPRRRNAHQSDWCVVCRENEAQLAERALVEMYTKEAPRV